MWRLGLQMDSPDFHGLYESSLNKFKPAGGVNQYVGQCRSGSHEDNNPSLSVNIDTGLFCCHACDWSGNAEQFANHINHPNPKQFHVYNNGDGGGVIRTPEHSSSVASPPKSSKPPVAIPSIIKTIDDSKKYLKNHTELIQSNWDKAVVESLDIGRHQNQMLYPYYDDCKAAGYKLGKIKQEPKGIKCRVFPSMDIVKKYDGKVLYIFAGEGDCITGKSVGLQGITFTAGEGSIPRGKDGKYDLFWLSKWKVIVICYDNDKAGGKGAEKLKNELLKVVVDGTIEIIQWGKHNPDGFDVSDAFKKDEGGGEFVDAIHNAIKFKAKAPQPKREDFPVLTLGEYMQQDFESTEPIIDSLLSRNQVLILGGDTGVGKTWGGLQCALSIVSGIPLFGYFKTKQMQTLLIQFENENDDIRRRLELMTPYFVQKSASTDWKDNLLVCPMNPEDEIFVDNWKRIEKTLIATGYRDGVLIVDNLYTNTDKNIQDNNELKELMRIIHRIRRQYNLTIILVAHTNKGVIEQQDLHYDQLQGGKVLASQVSNILQMHSSSTSVDLRVAKITKAGRSGKNELYNIPFKLHWSDDTCVFTKGTIISNIAVHFTNVKQRWEVELIKEIAGTYDFRASDSFTRDKFRNNLPAKYEGWYEAKITRFLNKMCDWGLVEKPIIDGSNHNTYRLKRNEIDEFAS